MGFLFKKNKVPQELPALALEEVQEDLKPLVEQKVNSDNGINNSSESKINELKSQTQQKTPTAFPTFEDDEKGFFKEIVKSVTEESEDIDKLDSWYKNKFLPEDVVFQMREYWQKQTPDIIMQNIRGDLKLKLIEKTEKLHQYEKEWQEIYFKLLSKEEEIRNEEKELKESLSEFIDIYKDKLKKNKK